MIDDLDLLEASSERVEIISLLEQLAQTGTTGHNPVRRLDVGTESFRSYIETEILDEYVANRGSTCRFFEGAYGAGKTHLLRLFESTAIERGMVYSVTELNASLAFWSFDQIVRQFLQTITLVVEDQIVRGLPAILRVLATSQGANLEQLKRASLPHAGFRRAMIYGASPTPIGHFLTRFLMGEKVTLSALKTESAVGVREPLSKKNAELVLQTVTGGLFALGVPGTLVMFDETEPTFQRYSATAYRRAVIAANLMRNLIDASTTGRLVGTVVVFTILPGFVEESGQTYQALGQRLERSLDDLPAWRQPVLDIADVSSLSSPEEFAEHAALRFVELVRDAGGSSEDLLGRLNTVAADVLETNAGSGYRRDLMKRMAEVSLRFVP